MASIRNDYRLCFTLEFFSLASTIIEPHRHKELKSSYACQNLCLCTSRDCECPPGAVQKYLSRISGPLLDRIDIQIEVIPVPYQDQSKDTRMESSKEIQDRVIRAGKIQQERFIDYPGVHNNAQISPSLMIRYHQPDYSGAVLLRNAMERLDLSARAYDRILKVARTIADLEGRESIHPNHLAEAINYRNLDRQNWGG